MKQSNCEIFLNPNGHCDGVYHSGQKLSGYVLVTFYEKQKINSESRFVVCLNFDNFFLKMMNSLKNFMNTSVFVVREEKLRCLCLLSSFVYFAVYIFHFRYCGANSWHR